MEKRIDNPHACRKVTSLIEGIAGTRHPFQRSWTTIPTRDAMAVIRTGTPTIRTISFFIFVVFVLPCNQCRLN